MLFNVGMSTTALLPVVALISLASFFHLPTSLAAAVVEGTNTGSLLAQIDVPATASNLGALTLRPLTTSLSIDELRQGAVRSVSFSAPESLLLEPTATSLVITQPALLAHTPEVERPLLWLWPVLLAGLMLCWASTTWTPRLRPLV